MGRLTPYTARLVFFFAASLIFSSCSFFRSFGTQPVRTGPGIYHVVKRGENLFRIGKAYDFTYRELARINRIGDVNQLEVGQKVFIPGATRQLPVEIITPTSVSLKRSAPSGSSKSNGTLPWPISGTVSSAFGPRGESFHDGIDILAPEGTPVQAVEDGEVMYSDQLRGYGNIIILRHGAGMVSVYAHNDKNLVREGQTVARGETIAEVGSTGRASAPHLHFEVRKDNIAEDPLNYLKQ